MYKYMKRVGNINKLLKVYQIIGFTFILITLVLIAIPTAPYVWYRLNPEAVSIDEEKIVKEIVQKKEDIEEKEQTPEK